MSYRYRFTVERVHDGDTVQGVLDAGLGIYLGRSPRPLYSIRFAGINAPELSTPEGKAARDFLQQYVHPGDVLDVESLAWDKYGWRIDGVPFTQDGVDLCDLMVMNGHAEWRSYD